MKGAPSESQSERVSLSPYSHGAPRACGLGLHSEKALLPVARGEVAVPPWPPKDVNGKK